MVNRTAHTGHYKNDTHASVIAVIRVCVILARSSRMIAARKTENFRFLSLVAISLCPRPGIKLALKTAMRAWGRHHSPAWGALFASVDSREDVSGSLRGEPASLQQYNSAAAIAASVANKRCSIMSLTCRDLLNIVLAVVRTIVSLCFHMREMNLNWS